MPLQEVQLISGTMLNDNIINSMVSNGKTRAQQHILVMKARTKSQCVNVLLMICASTAEARRDVPSMIRNSLNKKELEGLEHQWENPWKKLKTLFQKLNA